MKSESSDCTCALEGVGIGVEQDVVGLAGDETTEEVRQGGVISGL